MERIRCIYCIECLQNGKRYTGQTINHKSGEITAIAKKYNTSTTIVSHIKYGHA